MILQIYLYIYVKYTLNLFIQLTLMVLKINNMEEIMLELRRFLNAQGRYKTRDAKIGVFRDNTPGFLKLSYLSQGRYFKNITL